MKKIGGSKFDIQNLDSIKNSTKNIFVQTKQVLKPFVNSVYNVVDILLRDHAKNNNNKNKFNVKTHYIETIMKITTKST